MNTSSPDRSFRASFLAMLGICLVIMLIALDTSVVGTAMPRIVAELRGYSLYQWTASAYLMVSTVMIPITGRLGDLYGRKPFVLAAVIVFTLASAACGMAQSMLQLVLARGLQGLGGGMLIGVAFACVPDLFPDRMQRVRWQVMLSSAFGIAMAVGPSLGGWLTEHAGWRSVFYINLPVAALALVMIWAFLPRIVHHEGEDRSIDLLGAILLIVTIVGLQLVTEQGQAHGSGIYLGAVLWVAVIACGVGFVRHQYHTRAPIVPPDVLDNSGARKLMALGVTTGLTMFMLIFYVPLLLQGGFGQSPKEAGFVMTPLLVCVTLGSIINGRILPHLQRAERVIAWGQVGLCVCCLLLTQLSADWSPIACMLLFGACGVSLGFQLPNLTLQMMGVVGRKNLGVGSALIQSTRMVGSMIGVGIASVMVNLLYEMRIGEALAARHVTDPTLVGLLGSPQVLIRAADRAALVTQAQHLGVDVAPLLEAARQGLNYGIHMAFLLCALIAGLSILISLRLPRYEITKNR
jgi:EmrB/QacA subfamily drug resistance transporter